MTLITTTEKLKEFIPALAGIKESEPNSRFVDYKKDLEAANAFIKNELIGATIYGKLFDSTSADSTAIEELVIAVEAYKAAISFIPQNDLVLTESGFAVMSTDNQSPASKERVERLINTLKDNLALSIESLQLALEDDVGLRADWQGVKYCSYLPEHICNTSRVFSSFAMGYNGNSLEYVRLKPQLMIASQFIIKKIGKPLYDDLIANPDTTPNAAILNDVRMLFAAHVMQYDKQVPAMANYVLGYLIKNIANYPLFATHYGTPEKWVNDQENRIVVFGAPR